MNPIEVFKSRNIRYNEIIELTPIMNIKTNIHYWCIEYNFYINGMNNRLCSNYYFIEKKVSRDNIINKLMVETNYLLSSAKNKNELIASIEELNNGDTVKMTMEELQELLSKEDKIRKLKKDDFMKPCVQKKNEKKIKKY